MQHQLLLHQESRSEGRKAAVRSKCVRNPIYFQSGHSFKPTRLRQDNLHLGRISTSSRLSTQYFGIAKDY